METCAHWHRPEPALHDFSSTLALPGVLCYCRVDCNDEYHLAEMPAPSFWGNDDLSPSCAARRLKQQCSWVLMGTQESFG